MYLSEARRKGTYQKTYSCSRRWGIYRVGRGSQVVICSVGMWRAESYATMFSWEIVERKQKNRDLGTPEMQWPGLLHLQHFPGVCENHWRMTYWVRGRQHNGAPGIEVLPVGHGCHRLGSPQGVLLKMEEERQLVKISGPWGILQTDLAPRNSQTVPVEAFE